MNGSVAPPSESARTAFAEATEMAAWRAENQLSNETTIRPFLLDLPGFAERPRLDFEGPDRPLLLGHLQHRFRELLGLDEETVGLARHHLPRAREVDYPIEDHDGDVDSRRPKIPRH